MTYTAPDLPLCTITHANGMTTRVSAWDPNLRGATLTCPGWNCLHCLDHTR